MKMIIIISLIVDIFTLENLNLVVDVYYNTHRDCYSIRFCGLVIGYAYGVTLKNAKLIVSEEGRKRSLASGVKTVHAYARGTLVALDEIVGPFECLCLRLSCATYNRFKVDSFVLNMDTSEQTPVYEVDWCVVTGKGVWFDPTPSCESSAIAKQVESENAEQIVESSLALSSMDSCYQSFMITEQFDLDKSEQRVESLGMRNSGFPLGISGNGEFAVLLLSATSSPDALASLDIQATKFIGVIQARSAIIAETVRLTESKQKLGVPQRYVVHNRYTQDAEVDAGLFAGQTIVCLPSLPRSVEPLDRVLIQHRKIGSKKMSDLFKGFEQLLEFAKTLEEKIEKGEIKTEVQFSTRTLSSIPRTGSIPRVGNRGGGIGTSNIRPPAGANSSSSRSSTSTPPEPVVPQQTAAASCSLKDVGGLGEVLKELKELIAIPLKRPDLLAKFGLEPTRGVLLVGPPGTGKTLTARALAEELGVNYIAIVGPEVMGKYYGEAEQRLREIFEKAAKNAPCIVFIDEIDSLAPERSKVEGEVEKRLVAQLLGLMDGFAQAQGVIVLAATNRPEHLDPALRRPGRFDREVQFRVPDRQGRLEILQILSRSMPNDSTVNLDAIAEKAVGFVGSDLKALCQKAAYSAMRRQVPSIEANISDAMTVHQSDFLQALKEIKPAVLRSVEIESPNVRWEEIGGLEEIKHTLRESVEGALLHPELYLKTKARSPKGILLWGPPGTGKTLLAKAVASQARANFICVNGPELHSRWVGASEQAVRELFARARQAAPCVVFIDEIDTLAPSRGRYSGDSGVSDRVVGQLLTELDGLQTGATILVIAATNRPDTIDTALLRAGRLDLQLKVDLPDRESRLAILKVHNQDRPLQDVDLGYWAEATDGWNGADLALLGDRAAVEAIRRYRSQGMTDSAAIHITTEDFNYAYQVLSQQRPV